MSVLKTHLYRDGLYVGEVPTPQTVLDYLQKKANAKLAEDLAVIDRELNSHGPIFAEATKAAERDVRVFLGSPVYHRNRWLVRQDAQRAFRERMEHDA